MEGFMLYPPPPYEKLTILTIPAKGNCAGEVLADFDKLIWSNRLDSEYPAGDINYNEGKAKKSHPFHKISKYYGKNKDVFLFLTTLRSEKLSGMIMKSIAERVSNDPHIIEEFTKKIRIYLNRAVKGEMEADFFLNDSELTAFFNGYHADHPGHPRNIHENLNINVLKPDKVLDTSAFFVHTTPLMTAEKSELRKVKIFANGERVMNVFKDGEGKRNYVYTKQADLDLEIGWTAKNFKGDDLFCVVVLKINGGKVVLKKMSVEGEEQNAVVSIPELAKQNTSILVKSKNLHDLLDRLVIHRTKEAAIEIACVVQSSALEKICQQIVSTEKLTFEQLPKKTSHGDREVYGDFEKLDFSEGPFDTSDELNYNDGIEANPFDKIAKTYSRHKDIFLFNSILVNPEKRGIVLGIVEEKCRRFEDPILLLAQFKTKMDIYMERVFGGKQDARQVVRFDGVQGFFSGCHLARRGQPRNIHANLNLNVVRNGLSLQTSDIMDTVTPRMETEKSKLERVKLFGNGKRIMTVIKGENRQRNYVFSKLAKMELDIEWIGWEPRSGREIACRLVLEIKAGQISMRAASLDDVIVKLATIYTYAVENKDVLIRNKSLSKVLEEIFDNEVGGSPPLTIGTIKATIQPSFGGSLPSSIFDCHSHETMSIKLSRQPVDFGKLFEHPEFKEVLQDFEKLDFSPGPYNPDDKLNYNDGQKANAFTRIRKYYAKYKDIFLFIAVLHDVEQKGKILEIVKRKVGREPATLVEFVRSMKMFLDRATQGRKQAMEFLGREYSRGLVAFFAGSQSGDPGLRRNNHAHLNVDLGVSGKTFDVTYYFHRQMPRWDGEKSDLKSIKVYGNGKRVATVFKKGLGQRNYILSKFAEITLEVVWKALEFGPPNSCTRRERKCSAVLRFRQGDISIVSVSVDGRAVPPASILEFAKQNDKVFFRNKSLYDVMHFSSLKAAIKGATALFFTASGRVTVEDAKLNDVFLMLMLQDEEEKERILDMVSKRSSKPEETKQEFKEKMMKFKEEFSNGDYLAVAQDIGPTPGPSRAIMNVTAPSPVPVSVTSVRAITKPKRRIGVIGGGVANAGIRSKGFCGRSTWVSCRGRGKRCCGTATTFSATIELTATLTSEEFMVVGEEATRGLEPGFVFGTMEFDDGDGIDNTMTG